MPVSIQHGFLFSVRGWMEKFYFYCKNFRHLLSIIPSLFKELLLFLFCINLLL